MLTLLENFFTHKDFLGGLDLPGKLFSPLHFVFSACVLALFIALAIFLSKKPVKTVKRVLLIVWGVMIIYEIIKTLFEVFLGAEVRFEAGGIMPFYPCNVYLYTLPFCFAKNEKIRLAACGYTFTVGLIGATINFVYPVNVLSNYSCISFMGFHTHIYHGVMIFTMLVMLLSRYHTYMSITKWRYLLLPALPLLLVSIPANMVNFSPIGSDYMFFKCDSFFLPALVGSLSDATTTVMVYAVYLIFPALFYLPGLIVNKVREKRAAA